MSRPWCGSKGLLDSGQINKNDDNDARSVAVAAQRADDLPELSVEDHSMVLRVWARRYHDLGRLRTQAVCRPHALLRELIPGGVRKELRARQAIKVLDGIAADSPVQMTERDPSWVRRRTVDPRGRATCSPLSTADFRGVSGGEMAAHQLHVRLLVGLVELGQLPPFAGDPQHVEPA